MGGRIIYNLQDILDIRKQVPVQGPFPVGKRVLYDKYFKVLGKYQRLLKEGPKHLKEDVTPRIVRVYSYVESNRSFSRKWLREHGTYKGKPEKKEVLRLPEQVGHLSRFFKESKSLWKEITWLRKKLQGDLKPRKPVKRSAKRSKTSFAQNEQQPVKLHVQKYKIPVRKVPDKIAMQSQESPFGDGRVLLKTLGGISQTMPISQYKRLNRTWYRFRRESYMSYSCG